MDLFDYTVIRRIDRGSYGDVMMIKKCGIDDPGTVYAGKLVTKDSEDEGRSYKIIMNEKAILEELKGAPFIIQLVDALEDDSKVLLVMEYLIVRNLNQILKIFLFGETEVKFYAAEMIVGIEYLHSLGIMHRDIKLNNVGLDRKGHIAIIDFGLSKKDVSAQGRKRANSFCGTHDYMAPEIKLSHEEGYDESVDWWGLGVCIYRMLTRLFPYDEKYGDPNKIVFPRYISPEPADLITKLLNKDPEERFGGGGRGAEEIKAHPFFSATDWEKVAAKQVEPPDVTWVAEMGKESDSELVELEVP